MIHPTAVVDDGAEVADDVEVGAFTLVHGGVRLGSGTVIGSHCSVGEPTELAHGRPLILGAGCLVRSHTVIYAGSTFEAGLETGHHVTCLLYTSDAADERSSVDLGGRRIIKKKTKAK